MFVWRYIHVNEFVKFLTIPTSSLKLFFTSILLLVLMKLLIFLKKLLKEFFVLEHSSRESNMILSCYLYAFKPAPKIYTWHHLNVMNTPTEKKFFNHATNPELQNIVVSSFVTMTKDCWKYAYLDDKRDFWQLLKYFQQQLWHFTCQQEKMNKKQNFKFLYVIFNKIYLKENLLP